MTRLLLTRNVILFAAFIVCNIQELHADETAKRKVACIGDSITFGYGIKNRQNDNYPAQLAKLLGNNWQVENFGLNGHTLMNKGNAPYMKSPRYKQALAFQPDVVIIKLGTNDTKAVNWKHKGDYVKDYLTMIESFRKLPSKPEIFICKPVPVFPERWGITDKTVREEIVPLVEAIVSFRRSFWGLDFASK